MPVAVRCGTQRGRSQPGATLNPQARVRRAVASSFQIGVGSVIGGWDEGLVGKKIGSRVLLSVPSDKGYKAQGNTDAGIKGDDTLIFVVDLVGEAANDTPLDANAVTPSTP